jgi:hypothetical protein
MCGIVYGEVFEKYIKEIMNYKNELRVTNYELQGKSLKEIMSYELRITK